MSALGWCQEIKVLAETPLHLLSLSDCTPTSICFGMHTHTHTHLEIIYFFVNLMHFIIRVGEPHCLCLSAGLPTHLFVCVSLYACHLSFLSVCSLSVYLHSICLLVCLSEGWTVLNCLFLPISTE